jgi:hypothetical protein
MLEHGVDVYSAIEIADNAGRTALFEAVEVDVERDDDDDEEQKTENGQPKAEKITEEKVCSMIRILTNKKSRT